MIQEEQERRARLARVRQDGEDPYPARVRQEKTVKEFLEGFDQALREEASFFLTGRLRAWRKHGGLTFGTLEDGTGSVQVVCTKDMLGEETYARLSETVDVADFLEVVGHAFLTQKGERSLKVSGYRIITKALLPLPEKWHGLTDVETRYRQRYLDLLANPSVREIFRLRAKALQTIRHFLDERGFLEVETPVLQTSPGGASAEPFLTHHEALNADMYLRVAPELYLKRCLVGGYDRVYEVARCFRNEGIDHAHNPEFTQVEAYMAYADYEQLMGFLEQMVVEVMRACGLNLAAVPFRGHVLNFTPPWPRMTFKEALQTYTKINIEDVKTRSQAVDLAKQLRVPVEKTDSLMSIVDRIYKTYVRPKIIQPTYLYDYPVDMTPLAKRKASDPRYAEMFQLVYGAGEENIKAFSELNDPLDQEERFALQEQAREAGDKEAQFGDVDYVTALKHGLPPTAGFGIGIDRLTALLTDASNIKEVILFPTLRPTLPDA
jgi:lysyl-tRNA synthetase class 2